MDTKQQFHTDSTLLELNRISNIYNIETMEDVFVKGLIFKTKSPKAPDFVIGGLSIKRTELIEFLQSKTDEWINAQIKISKAGKPYIVVDNWKPKAKEDVKEEVKEETDNNSLPF